MSSSPRLARLPSRPVPAGMARRAGLLALLGAAGLATWPLGALANPPVTGQQRATAQQVAEAGVPVADLAPNAPDSHTVQRGDTLWDISRLFLKQPWRWPELWGMNLQQIRNPHLIFPGQVLVLDKVGGRARLRVAGADGRPPSNTVRLSPLVRAQTLPSGAISAVPLHLIGPFLNEAVVLSTDQLTNAPRIVAAQDGRVLMSKGELAYVRGDVQGHRSFAVLRQAEALRDPSTQEVLGYEAAFVGTADLVRGEGRNARGDLPVPATVLLTAVRQEATVGDRLLPVPARDFDAFTPRAPLKPVQGQVISVYGEALTGGQNQIVAINRGTRDGMERGHVLALWRAGALDRDTTGPGKPQAIQLPDERSGLLFVFRVFDRVSYALIVSATDPVRSGDRFTQP